MTRDEGWSNRSLSSMSGCSGPCSPPDRASCSHFPSPAPPTHPFLKSNPPLPFFLLQAPSSSHGSSQPPLTMLPISAITLSLYLPSAPLPHSLFSSSRPLEHPLAAARYSCVTQRIPRALPSGSYNLRCFFWLLP